MGNEKRENHDTFLLHLSFVGAGEVRRGVSLRYVIRPPLTNTPYEIM